MNWIDLIIILVILAFAIEGSSSSFLDQALNILGFAFSLIIALTLYSQLGTLLTKTFNLAPIAASPVAFLVVWIVTESLFFSIINLFLAKHLFRFENNKLFNSFSF